MCASRKPLIPSKLGGKGGLSLRGRLAGNPLPSGFKPFTASGLHCFRWRAARTKHAHPLPVLHGGFPILPETNLSLGNIATHAKQLRNSREQSQDF